SPINPFQVGIAQQLAQLPLLSGWLFRIAFLAAALGIWIWGTVAYAARTRTTSTTAPDPTAATLDGRRGAVLALVLVSFAALVVGVLRFGWGFNEVAALFFAMGVIAGLVGGLCELFTPTNGALMAILAAAQVRYEEWLRFALPPLLTLLGLGAGAIGLGVATRLQ